MFISAWDKWQTYRKDRGTPPWIKVYRNLFSNEEWASLSDSEKGQLVSLWILAADKHGFIPDNPKVLQKMCMLDDPPNINKFIDLGFMASSGLPDGDQLVTIAEDLDIPETETETETETELYRRIFDHWNSLKIITHREMKKFLPFIKARLENYSEKDITDAMDNYSKIIKGEEYFWTHRWTLEDFLSRKKALDQFLTENDPFSNYLKDKNSKDVDPNHPHYQKIMLLTRIISKKATTKEETDYSKNYNDISYDAMRQRASDEKERLMRD